MPCATCDRASARSSPTPTHVWRPCCQTTWRSLPACSTSAVASVKRRANTTASHPSPRRPALRAASLHPPTTKGMAGPGIERIRPPSKQRTHRHRPPSTGEETSNTIQCRVGPPSTSGRVNPAHLELVTVLTADPDPDRDSARRCLSEGCDSGRHHRVPQGEQKHAEVKLEPRFDAAQGGGYHPIDAVATNKADVIRSEQVIDTGIGDLDQPGAPFVRLEPVEIPGSRKPNPQGHPIVPPTVSMLSWPASPAARCTAAARHSSDVDMASSSPRFGYLAIATIPEFLNLAEKGRSRHRRTRSHRRTP